MNNNSVLSSCCRIWFLCVLLLHLSEAKAADTITTPVKQFGYGWLICADHSPANSTFITGSSDGKIRLCCSKTGLVINELEGHNHQVNSVSFSPDGSKIISSSYDKTVRVWDAATGKEMFKITQPESYSVFAAVSSDGERVLDGTYENTHLWDGVSGNSVKTFPAIESNIINNYNFCFSPNDSLFVVGNQIRDAESGELIQSLPYSGLSLFSPDGTKILTASDRSFHIYDLHTGESDLIYDDSEELCSGCMPVHIWPLAAFSPDGAKIITKTDNITIMDADGQNPQSVPIFENDGFLTIDFTEDGSEIFIGNLYPTSNSNTIMLYNPDNDSFSKEFLGHIGPIVHVDFSDDETKVITNDIVWNKSDGTPSGFVEPSDTFDPSGPPADDTSHINPVAYSPDGTLVASRNGKSYRSIEVRNTETGVPLYTLETSAEGMRFYRIIFSPDGSEIITGSSGIAQIWNVKNGTLKKNLYGYYSYVSHIVFSHCGRYIATGSLGGTVKVWNNSWNLLWSTDLPQGSVQNIMFSPDNTHLLIAARTDALITKVEDGELVRCFSGHSLEISSLKFSSDGTHFLAGSRDGTAKLWRSGLSGTNVTRNPQNVGARRIFVSLIRNKLTISVKSDVYSPDASFAIHTLSGDLVRKHDFSSYEKGQFVFPLSSHLPSGFYLYRFNSGAISYNGRIVKTDAGWKMVEGL